MKISKLQDFFKEFKDVEVEKEHSVRRPSLILRLQKHHGVARDCSFLQISLEAGQHHRALHCEREREQSVTGPTNLFGRRVAHRTLSAAVGRDVRHEVRSCERCDVGLAQEE